ncbi:MAG: hypothetical protein ACI9XO_003945 [Paraglaciecola sp.]|jgi:hypothetical protein
MYRNIALLLLPIFFFQCENPKVNVEEQTEEVAKETPKGFAVKKDQKTFKLERKKPANKIAASRTAKQPNMTGYFVYAADAAIFYPCGSSKHYPVSGNAYLELEKAYMGFEDRGFAEKIYVKIIGEYDIQPGMEGRREKQVVISEFLGFERGKNCE